MPRDYGGKHKETRREYNARFSQPTGPEAEIPPTGNHIWEWFWLLNNRRQYSQNGPQALTFSEIDAWRRLTGTLVTAEEIRILIAMDAAYISETADEMESQHERAQSRQSAKHSKFR